MNSTVVHASHRYTAPIERVFDAWVTPAQASRFLFATRTGNIMRCEMDVRPGGQFQVTDRRPNADGDVSVFDAIHRGEYVEIDRPFKLVFDFSVLPYTETPTRVTLEFKPLSTMACELNITHDMGNSEEARLLAEQSRKGWERMLRTLERELFPKRVGVQL